MERVLANIDADHGDCALELLGHGMLLVFGAPSQHSIAGGAGARPDHPIIGNRTQRRKGHSLRHRSSEGQSSVSLIKPGTCRLNWGYQTTAGGCGSGRTTMQNLTRHALAAASFA